MGGGRTPSTALQYFPVGTPRWRWEDVDRKLSGQKVADTSAAMMGAMNFGKAKGNRRDVA
jgi:hypothetical protein